MIYAGIDPGKKGAIAMVRSHHSLDDVWGYRLASHKGGYCGKGKGVVEPDGLATAWRSLVEELDGGPIVAVLEQQRAGKGQGVTSMFTTGDQYGQWRMMLHLMGVPYVVVTAQEWRKVAGIVVPRSSDPKAATIAHVSRLVTDVELVPPGCSTAHDGLADAMGIAMAARVLRHSGRL